MELMVRFFTRKMGGVLTRPGFHWTIFQCAAFEQPFTALNMAVFTFFSHNWLVVTGTMEWILTFQKQLGME